MTTVVSSFTVHAARLAGLAGVLFGWRPGEFWRATPEELAGVLAALTGEAAIAGAPPDADTVARLRARFPDETDEESPDER